MAALGRTVTGGEYTFNLRCGALARLSNGARTVERRRPLSEFNNAVTMSSIPLIDGVPFEVRIEGKVSTWSGSLLLGVTTKDPESFTFPASISSISKPSTWVFNGESVWKDGKKTIRTYGPQRIEMMPEGHIVGVVRRDACLHFLVNGEDLGVVERGIEDDTELFVLVDLYGKCSKASIVHKVKSNVAVPQEGEESGLLFHSRCGKQAEVQEGGTMAMRKNCQGEFNHGVVLTSQPLVDGQVFEVEITRMVDKWAGSIEMGVTTHSPEELNFPSTMTNMRSGTWMLSGSGVMRDGDTIRENFGRSLDSLKTGERVGVMRRSSGALVFFINGREVGVAAEGLPSDVYGVVDLYGQCAEVTIPSSNRTPSSTPTSPSSDSPISSPFTLATTESLLIDTTPLQFHSLHGENVVLSDDLCTASRSQPGDEFTKATVFSSRMLAPDEWFEVEIVGVEDTWSGSIQIGVCKAAPESLNFEDIEEISDAAEESWVLSGSEVFHDGNVIVADYDLDVDEVHLGARVGVMVTADGDLHYSYNSIDMGRACGDIPTAVYATVDVYGQCAQITISDGVTSEDRHDNSVVEPAPPTETTPPVTIAVTPPLSNTALLTPPTVRVASGSLLFHANCGRNIQLSNGCSVATRTSSYKYGVVFSSRELKSVEKFEVKLVRLNSLWKGLLKIGLTTCRPDRLAAIPPTASLLPHHSWVLSGEALMVDGVAESGGYGKVLSRLKEGSSVGVWRSPQGAMHLCVDGQDLGPVAHNLPERVSAVVDLYGPVERVRMVDRGATSVVPGHDTTGQDGVVLFSESCGENVRLSNNCTVAKRVKSYSKAIALSSTALPRNKIFQVELVALDPKWSGSLRVGLTTMPPSSACLVDRASDLPGSSYVLCAWNGASWLFVGGQAKQQLSASVDLLSLHQGQTVGVAYSTDDSVLFFVDERLVCRVDAKLPQACYALVDLYGPCCEVKVQPLHPVLPEALKLVAIANGAQPQPTSSSPLLDQARPISGTPVAARTTVLGKRDSVSTSVVINGRLIDSMAGDLDDSPRSKLPPVAMGAGDGRGTSVCSYRKLCGRFLKSLAIPEAYFDRTPQHSKCYCEKCSAARGDPRVKLQGEPHPMKYTVPHGWVKFGLRLDGRAEAHNAFRQWHVAYHGTTVGSVRHILDSGGLLLRGDLTFANHEVSSRPGHFTKDCRPAGFDVQQIFLSPSIKYSTEGEVYSQKYRYRDASTGRHYWAKVAFKTRIYPTSYQVLPQTVLPTTGRQIDKYFDNSELEWSTKERGAVILYGLLVKLTAVDGGT